MFPRLPLRYPVIAFIGKMRSPPTPWVKPSAMAKKSEAPKGNSLVIVESPAKARTIGKFLGKGYTVEASIGHIRDLPEGKKDVPDEHKSAEWARLGVNTEADFVPLYVVPKEKRQHIAKLKKLVKESSNLYLATDEDREGEAISWHLKEVLQPKIPIQRLVFHEITDEAIHHALEHPRQIDDGLVRAQETRRILKSPSSSGKRNSDDRLAESRVWRCG